MRGDEHFSIGPSVLDFWRWTLGDLRMNTARGYLAEFSVAKAVGSKAPMRIEWAAHDVDAEDGTRLEVKGKRLFAELGADPDVCAHLQLQERSGDKRLGSG